MSLNYWFCYELYAGKKQKRLKNNSHYVQFHKFSTGVFIPHSVQIFVGCIVHIYTTHTNHAYWKKNVLR